MRGFLRNLLRDTIESLFDNDIYGQAQKKKPKPRQIKPSPN
jgi:hypothetical protein